MKKQKANVYIVIDEVGTMQVINADKGLIIEVEDERDGETWRYENGEVRVLKTDKDFLG